eukprot:CAMPEP_0114353264 /NCGR_PEP_ID=MMETSP0101-20121206/18536_1 /TAXON_ID=38822 ORGANISM="Pteridomonas danica, Strain PT" /NCGR_SAMPLE_ID=MMETSP0101 /ASSEMBLY_ACC=CAM_ASM_000211 /LENGTH=254 /DNA_ID=CAMNT_0001494019 /DNA_START=128 /DNA_END=891 /DNA_ORIENTATION=+
MSSTLVECIEFNPITPTKASKRLMDILTKEKVTQLVRKSEVDLIGEKCHGDLRSAINELQIKATKRKPSSSSSSSSSSRTKQNTNTKQSITSSFLALSSSSNSSSSSSSRTKDVEEADGLEVSESLGDKHMSSLHCVAKLLHGNKSKTANVSSNRTHPTQSVGQSVGWHPEALAAQCDMGVDGLAAFIQHNCVEFYSDSDELAKGLEKLSDSDQFISRLFDSSHTRDRGDTTFPEGYAVSSILKSSVSNKPSSK